MVKLRLTKTGRKGVKSYRVIAVHGREKRETKALEILGHYSPTTKEIKIDKERAEYWMSVGAQPTDTVVNLFVKAGILNKKDKYEPKYSKKPGKKATERNAKAAEKTAAAAAPAPAVEVETPAAAESEAPAAEAN
ncbi:MAG: 30S ribosomal protein S16 [Candidatus Doudnabacteria bacterium]|nr:30S ribosomal protein S16 [Candidatus Doudnabacteria bacterium]